MQRMEGELAATIQKHLPQIGHIQLADNPGRNEPGTGEINYRFLFEFIDRLGYDGWIGCEYKPAGNTSDGLGWMQRPSARLTATVQIDERHEHGKSDSSASGIMGEPMAGHLIKGGHELYLNTRSGVPDD